MTEVTLKSPDDLHLHVRDGDVMRTVVSYTARHFGRALIMPNVPAIETGEQAASYREKIESASDGRCDWLMSIKLTGRTTPEMVLKARRFGVISAKLYPSGVTTGSHDGITDPWALRPVCEAMADCGMVLCIHAESPGAFVLGREDEYREDVVARIVEFHPKLRVVMEHITTMESVAFVAAGPENLAATITAHHLIHTLDDVIGDGIRPHHFCYPVPKRPCDRAALVRAARGYYGQSFIFGSDSAPHARDRKESACGCAGVFSAPVAMSILADVFLGDDPGEKDVRQLQEFTSERGADFYGLPRNTGTIRLVRRPWTVQDEIGGIVPFLAGREMAWAVET